MPWRVTYPFTFRARATAQDTVRFAAAAMRLSFSEAFHAPLTWCSERCQGEKWRTKYNHSGDIPLSRGLGMSGSESETFMGPVYLGLGVNHFHIDRGTLSLLAEPASERVKSTVEAPIKISTVPGTWPGRLSDEIDVMELLGGGPTRQRKSDHGRVDRQKRDQSKTLDKVDLGADFTAYGLFWMADTIAHYLDSVEVGRSQTWAELSKCYRKPGDRAFRSAGGDRKRRIAAARNRGEGHRFCQLSRRSCADPTPTCIWLVCHIRNASVKDAIGLSIYLMSRASSGMLVRNPVATATASILSVRVAMLSRASRKTTLEAALQNVT